MSLQYWFVKTLPCFVFSENHGSSNFLTSILSVMLYLSTTHQVAFRFRGCKLIYIQTRVTCDTLLKRSSNVVYLYSKMTIKEKVKESILAWGCAPCGLTWSFGLQMVIIGFFLAGFCSDHWLESSIVVSGYEYRSQGLWRFCNESQGTTCCGYISDLIYVERKLFFCRIVNFELTGWVHVKIKNLQYEKLSYCKL